MNQRGSNFTKRKIIIKEEIISSNDERCSDDGQCSSVLGLGIRGLRLRICFQILRELWEVGWLGGGDGR
jgi:hypothetical protein